MKTIEVVAAVIIDNERNILATQRGYGEFKGKWEFPGGKIKTDELREDALKREIKEELDVDIEVEDYLLTIEYDYPNFHLTMHTYISKIISGEISLNEHMGLKWLKKEELKGIDWIEADVEIVEKLWNLYSN